MKIQRRSLGIAVEEEWKGIEWYRLESRTYTPCFDLIDGERCGETLQSIFENAKDPDKVIIGLVEQNAHEVRQVERQSISCLV